MYLDSLFDDDALECCKTLWFDPVSNEVIDIDTTDAVGKEVDEQLQGFWFNGSDDSDDDTDSSGGRTQTTYKRGVAREKKALQLGDEDSISTFCGRLLESIISPPRRKAGKLF